MGQSKCISSFSGTVVRTIISLVKYTHTQTHTEDHEDFQLKRVITICSSLWYHVCSGYCICIITTACMHVFAQLLSVCYAVQCKSVCMCLLSFNLGRKKTRYYHKIITESNKNDRHFLPSCNLARSDLIIVINCSPVVTKYRPNSTRLNTEHFHYLMTWGVYQIII